MKKEEIRKTRVWEVDHVLVVADNAGEAVEIYRAYFNGDADINNITPVRSSTKYGPKDALIKGHKECIREAT